MSSELLKQHLQSDSHVSPLARVASGEEALEIDLHAVGIESNILLPRPVTRSPAVHIGPLYESG
jgi:hypothetical protein